MLTNVYCATIICMGRGVISPIVQACVGWCSLDEHGERSTCSSCSETWVCRLSPSVDGLCTLSDRRDLLVVSDLGWRDGRSLCEYGGRQDRGGAGAGRRASRNEAWGACLIVGGKTGGKDKSDEEDGTSSR